MKLTINFCLSSNNVPHLDVGQRLCLFVRITKQNRGCGFRNTLLNFIDLNAISYSEKKTPKNSDIICIQLDRTPSARTRKINLPANQIGYDKPETMYEKLLAKKIQICGDYFCVIKFLPLFQNNFLHNVRTKIVPAESDLPR